MSDALNVFGIEYVGVAGIKASGTDGNIKTYIRPQGTKSISANGTGIDVTEYASVDVAVPSGTPTLEIVTKSYTPTESQQTETITPGSEYDGIAEVDVTVGAISSSYVGSGITRRDSTDLSASGATVSVPSGYYENNASKTIPNASLGVKSISKTKADGKFTTKFSWDDATEGYFNQVLINSLNYAAQDSLVLENKTVTPTTSQQVVTPTIPKDNYLESVTVLAMPSGSVTAPATISGSGAAVSAATNTLTLTKTVSVTPSVTTAGYVSAGTAGNSSVDLTASVPTQTAQTYGPQAADRTIASGTYLLGAQTIKGAPLQSKTVTSNGTVYPDTGYYGLSDVVVNVGGSSGTQIAYDQVHPDASTGYLTFGVEDEPTSFVLIALNDISTGSPSRAAAVVGDGTNIIGQTITNTSNAQVSYSSGAFSCSYSSNDKLFTIYASGADFQPINYGLLYSYGGNAASIGTADVQVGSGATSITFTGLEDEPIYWSCLFKSNFSTSNGYQRVIAVASDDTGSIIGLEMDTAAHSTVHWTSSYSNGSLTITSNGTNQGGYFHQPGYYQLTYAIGEPSPYQTKSVTYTPTTTQQTDTITPSAGYDALSQVNVTVNAMPTMTLPSSSSATSSGTSKATITPTSSAQYLNIPTGYNATAQYYTIAASSGGGGSLTVATKTLTNTATTQTLSFSSLSGQPKYWFLRCTSNVSSSGSTTYYYVTDCFYDGTSVKGNTFRIGSTRRVQNVTSGISQSYSGNTLTITAGSSSGATPGQFYGASGIGYELVYVY